jgi:diadenosine tetraphosphate (Ap4A) HIT family hydrolase
MNEDCLLCNPKEEALIFRGADGIVILDDPIRPGHVLIGARNHGASLHDISSEDAAAMMRLANIIAKVIVSETGAEKVYVAAIGDKDKHFHVHLIPKMESEPKLGPYIFSNNGWASFLPPENDPIQQSGLTNRIRIALRDVHTL